MTISNANTLRSRRRLALASAAAISLAGSAARAEDWPTPGLDATHARLSSERSGTSFTGGKWTASSAAGARVLASPVVADGYVVSVDLEGAVRALSGHDGALVWQASVGAAVQGTPAVARGRVFVPTIGNAVVALRLSDGVRLWTRDVGGMTLSSPTPLDGDLVVAAGFPQRHVLRLSGATGEVVWQSPSVMEQFSNNSPAVGSGLVTELGLVPVSPSGMLALTLEAQALIPLRHQRFTVARRGEGSTDLPYFETPPVGGTLELGLRLPIF